MKRDSEREMGVSIGRSKWQRGWCLAAGVLSLSAGCAHQAAPAASTPAASAAPAPAEPVAPEEHVSGTDSYALLLSAAGCWYGGAWAQAEGEDDRADRRAQTEAHCHDVLNEVYGPGTDDGKMRQLRALEQTTTADVRHKLESLSKSGDDKRDLGTLFDALAGAMRENNAARRGADKIAKDTDGERAVTRISDDEKAAIEPLSAHAAIDALVNMKAGRFSADAHGLGLLAAMDRFALARDLPRHLKIFALRDIGKLLFGARAPDVATDPTKPMQPGTWLEYLVNLAIAANHEPSPSAKDPKVRHELAWAGVLGGIADQLEADENAVDPRFQPIMRNTVAELRASYRTVLHPR